MSSDAGPVYFNYIINREEWCIMKKLGYSFPQFYDPRENGHLARETAVKVIGYVGV